MSDTTLMDKISNRRRERESMFNSESFILNLQHDTIYNEIKNTLRVF